jgi:hypothetical protein
VPAEAVNVCRVMPGSSVAPVVPGSVLVSVIHQGPAAGSTAWMAAMLAACEVRAMGQSFG